MPWSKFLNIEELREITDGDRTIERKFVEMFMQNLQSSLVRLEPLIEADVENNWPKIIHELKGAAANIRAERLHQICSHAESLIVHEDKQAAYDKIRAEYARYYQALSTPLQ